MLVSTRTIMLYTLPMIRGSDRVEWPLSPSAAGDEEGLTATPGDEAGIGIDSVLVRRDVLVVPTSDVAELVEVDIGTDIIEGATTLVLSPIAMEEVVGFGVVIRTTVVVVILVGLGVTGLLLS